MPVVCVTSMSIDYHGLIGRDMIASWHQHWPRDVELLIFSEDSLEIARDTDDEAHDLRFFSPEFAEFEARHRDNLLVHGRVIDQPQRWKDSARQHGQNFRYDAWKFCRKIFALQAATRLRPGSVLIWLDADLLTLRRVDEAAIKRWLPPGSDISFYGRGTYHSDACFVGFGTETGRRLIDAWAELYASDYFLGLKEWHDAWLFDWLRYRSEGRVVPKWGLSRPVGASAVPGGGKGPKALQAPEIGSLRFFNLNPGNPKRPDAFAHSLLGPWFAHLKGKRKHETGRRLVAAG